MTLQLHYCCRSRYMPLVCFANTGHLLLLYTIMHLENTVQMDTNAYIDLNLLY